MDHQEQAIKAVAKDTRRHIFNISLRQTTTQTQLKNLFYNPEIHVLRNGGNEIVNIPLDKRLYVIEDIDCLTDIVISRSKKSDTLPETTTNNYPSASHNNYPRTQLQHQAEPKTELRKIQQLIASRLSKSSSSNNKVININPGEYIEFDDENAKKQQPEEPYGLSGLMSEEVSELYGYETMFNCQDYGNNFSLGTNAARSLEEMYNTDLGGNNIKLEPFKEKPNTNDKDDEKDKKTNNKIATDPHPEQLNLSFLLNLLDGVLETPGRILIITTNHPERLDKALIRPGRVDIHLQVGNCSREMIIDILRFFYNDPLINFPDWNYEKAITPAEVNKIILNNFDNPNAAITEIRIKTRHQHQDDNLADLLCGE